MVTSNSNGQAQDADRGSSPDTLPPIAELILRERVRIAADATYTPGELLRLSMAFDLMGSSRPTARIKGLDTYERVEAAHPGSHVPVATPEDEALAVAERRLAEMRDGE